MMNENLSSNNIKLQDSIELRDQGCRFCRNRDNMRSSFDDFDDVWAYIRPLPNLPRDKEESRSRLLCIVDRYGKEKQFLIHFCPWCGKRFAPFTPNDYIGETSN